MTAKKIMLAQVRKDTNSAYCRILDHKAFLGSEIEKTLYNFETQRNDNEVETLLKAAETVAELKLELIDRCIDLSNTHLRTISKTLCYCLQELEEFASDRNQTKQQSDFLAHSREKRIQQKYNFSNDLDHKYKRIQNTFEEKEEEIAEIYTDLQRKLNIQK